MKTVYTLRRQACALAVTLFSITASHAQTVIIDYDTPHADSWVLFNNATNYGTGATNPTMYTQNNGTTTNRRTSYVRFDLLAGDAAEDLGTFEDPAFEAATLTFRLASLPSGKAANTIMVYGLNPNWQGNSEAGILGQDWGEAAINGTNAPANASHPGLAANTTFLGEFNIPAASTNPAAGTEFPISTQALVDFLNWNLDSNQPHYNLVTFLIMEKTATSGQPSQWVTKEHTTLLPTSLSVYVVPEPASLSLVAALGALGFAHIYRKRSRIS